MPTSYDEMADIANRAAQASKPKRNFLGNLADVGQAIGYGLEGKIYAPQDETQNTASALMKSMIMNDMAQKDAMNKATMLEDYKRSLPPTPIEQANLGYRNAQIEALKNQPASPSNAGIKNYGMSAGQRPLSPILQKVKDTRTENIMNNLEQNNIKRDMINNAMESSKKIQGGLYGKIQRGFLRGIDPKNPILGDWQNIKMVLTDAQLMNVAKTKGAISDREMELFSKAAANDDIASLPQIIPVLNKVLRTINADEQSSVNSYKKLYGEDPTQWEGYNSNLIQQQSQIPIPMPQQQGQMQPTSKVGKYTRVE
jgi:hypothetical protein